MQKNKKGGCLSVILALLAIGFVVNLFTGGNKETTKTESAKTEQTSTSSSSESSSSDEGTTEPSSAVKYDVAQMNVKITDSFNESVQFNQEGHDGYEWTAYIYELKLKENGAINATVNDNFLTLSDAEKTNVLNSVSRAVNLVVFLETNEDKSYYITAYDKSGNKVARSKMLKVLEYKFY